MLYRTNNRKACWRIWIFVACKKYGKQLLYPGLYALKTTSKNVVHKASEAIGELTGSKIPDKVVKKKAFLRNNHTTREERRNSEWIKISVLKWITIKYRSYQWFNCINVSKKKYIEVNELSSHQYSAEKNIRFQNSYAKIEFMWR